MLLGAAVGCSVRLQRLGWRHHICLCTDQLVLTVDVNDGTQSAGIRLAVSSVKMDTCLEFTDTGLQLSCGIIIDIVVVKSFQHIDRRMLD